MLLLNFNKAGVWTTLVLLLFILSLYPARGRPSFGDEDTVVDEDHQEEDEDHVDGQDGLQDEDEENASTSAPMTEEECKKEAEKLKEKDKQDAALKVCLDAGKPPKSKGAAGGGAATDEYDD